MTDKEMMERIKEGRARLHWSGDYESDQKRLKPQPPLVKAAVSDQIFELPKNFEALSMKTDFVRILYDRRSNRVFTNEHMDLLTLSFLLWAQQGVKGIRGKNYATLRTVPSAGARHAFECYFLVLNVDGLKPGMYHYLPMEHKIELLKEANLDDTDLMDQVTKSVSGQKWALKANVIFYYSVVPYRCEWRYSYNAQRVMMIDAGHVTENLYLACSALGAGTCAIAAIGHEAASGLFDLDEEEETIFYCAPVGTVSKDNEDAEQAFYAFLKEK